MKQVVRQSAQKKLSKNVLPKMSKKMGPVIWAMDPSTINDEVVRRFQSLLSSLKCEENEVFPATIFSPFDLGWLSPVGKELKSRTLKALTEKVKKQWDQHGINHDKAGFIIAESTSKRDQALALIQFAMRKKAKMIIVGSGAKSRNNLTGLGSFSETLISLSPVPVLVIGESVETFHPITKILFPTDFSQSSVATFKKVVQMAKTYGAEVILYHFLNLEQGPMAFGIPWGYEIRWLDEYWKMHSDLRQEEGDKLSTWAARHGVKCQFICDRKTGVLSERIMEVAKNNQVDLLPIAVKRGPWSQVILGGTVRHIFAHATCPVMAIHATLKKEKLHS